MNTRKYWFTKHLASIKHQLSTAMGVTLAIILVSGCAAQSSPGYLRFGHSTPVVRCREGTIEFCEVLGRGRPLGNFNQVRSCDCVNPDMFRPMQGYIMRQRRPRQSRLQ